VCENVDKCSLKYSIYSSRCPCDKCIINVMCTIACKAHTDFRLMVLRTNAVNDMCEIYKVTKKHQSRF